MSKFTEKLDRAVLPVIPMRGLVAFPGIDTSFEVARPQSVKAVEMALQADQRLYLVTQKDLNIETPAPDQLYRVGVVVRIKQSLKLPDKSFRLVVEGLCRAETENMFVLESGALTGEVLEKRIEVENDLKCEAYRRSVLEAFTEYSGYIPKLSHEVGTAIHTITDPGFLADFIAANIFRRTEDKQAILEVFDPLARIELLGVILENEIRISKLEARISRKVQTRIDRQQREYYLREQLRVIQAELGGGKEDEDELPPSDEDELKTRIEKADLPQPIREKLLYQTGKLVSMPFGSSEAALVRNYVETCLEIPWNQFSRDSINIEKARRILDKDHEGLEKVKERVLEFLAAKQLGGDMKGQILCLVGAPGVGKTSIGASVARALGRKYVRVSLGGIRDEADIRGHRKTYIGSMPGRIIASLTQAGTMNPLIALDEIDKLTSDSHGDPASALLEALDSEQNHAFRDHFVELPVDLSKCMFLATANSVDTIPSALLDRMEVIFINGYTEGEKIAIAQKHLIPKQEKQHGIGAKNLKISPSAISAIISLYTREQGVRNLEREIARLCRKAAKNIIEGKSVTKVTAKNIFDYLGKAKIKPEEDAREADIGVVNGLAWTMGGGELLKIEAQSVPGTGKLELTGSLGDVMKESAKAAVTYIRANSEKFGVKNPDFYKNCDLHIHLPEGAVPKDGPSAGVTLVTCLVSLLSEKRVKGNVAMTGEITLHGKVLPIGGLREKSNAALRTGMDYVLFPEANKPDLDEVDPRALEKIKFIPVRDVEGVLKIALEANA